MVNAIVEIPDQSMIQRLDLFSKRGLDRGRPKYIEVLWYIVRVVFFQTNWPWPSRVKRQLLILFGARVGVNLYIRPRVSIHFPWKLTLGDHCQIGDGCQILNLEPVTIEDQCVIGHEVYLAAGGHNPNSQTFEYANKPIVIRRGCWLATRAFIGPGVTIGENCIIGACAFVVKSVPPNSIVGASRATLIGQRVFTDDLVEPPSADL